jgi:ABC-type uncharacterized transport system substrate-binding protein
MRLPTIYGEQEHVESGGLMSYGANTPDLLRRSADYVDKIQQGRSRPTSGRAADQVRLVINSIAAKAFGLTVPPMVLARADEVIDEKDRRARPRATSRSARSRPDLNLNVIYFIYHIEML